MAMLVFLVVLLSVVQVNAVNTCRKYEGRAIDCSNLYRSGKKISGTYSICLAGHTPVRVYCHMVSTWRREDGGWTVIQRRREGTVNFYRPWRDYRRGFGNVESEYWLGLENMYQLTRRRKYMLRVDLEDFTGRKGFALYSSFSVGSESDGYRLEVSGFQNGGAAGDALSFHNGQKFSTFDKDQDSWPSNCAKQYLGGFWYNNCYTANLNGVYLWGEDSSHNALGTVWYPWRNGLTVVMKSITMKIKPL